MFDPAVCLMVKRELKERIEERLKNDFQTEMAKK